MDRPEIAKGYETPDGRTVVLREEDLEALPLPSKHVIDVLGFVPVDGLDPLLFSRGYYAAPHGQAGQRPYALLVAALARAERAAVAKVTLRTRERLAALWPRRDTLVVRTLLCSLVKSIVGNDGVGCQRNGADSGDAVAGVAQARKFLARS